MTRILTIIALLFATPASAFLFNFEMYCYTPDAFGANSTLYRYERAPVAGDKGYVWDGFGWEMLSQCKAVSKKVKCEGYQIDFSAKKIFLANGRYIDCFTE